RCAWKKANQSRVLAAVGSKPGGGHSMNTAPATTTSPAEVNAAAPARRYSHFQSSAVALDFVTSIAYSLSTLGSRSGTAGEPSLRGWRRHSCRPGARTREREAHEHRPQAQMACR